MLYYQPNLHGTSEQNNFGKKILLFLAAKLTRNNFFTSLATAIESNVFFQFFFFFFLGSAFYTTSFLPYGRFFNRVGGNWGFLWAYFFVFFYLGFRGLRRSIIWEMLSNYSTIVSIFLRNLFRAPKLQYFPY